MKPHPNKGACGARCTRGSKSKHLRAPVRGLALGKRQAFPEEPFSATGAPWPRTSYRYPQGPWPVRLPGPGPARRGHLSDARAAAGALRHPRPPGKRPGASLTARARAASSAVCNPAGEEGIAATSQPGGFQGGGASREAAALPAGARAHPPPRVPAAPGNVGHQAERPHVSPPAAAASAPIM